MTFGRTITIKTIQIPHVIDTKIKSIPTTDYTPFHSNLSPLLYLTSPDIYLLTLPSTPTHQSTDLVPPSLPPAVISQQTMTLFSARSHFYIQIVSLLHLTSHLSILRSLLSLPPVSIPLLLTLPVRGRS